MKKNLLLKSRKLHLRIGHFSGICILSLLAAFIIFGCTKKEANLQDDLLVVNDITFRDGRLIFKDDSTFINHQNWLLNNQGNRQLIADKNKSLGLKSMTEYYFEGMKLEETDPLFLTYVDKYPNIFNKVVYDNSTLYELPHSMLLCYVANKDGIYQVGDKINRIAGDCIYQINDESKIDMLFLPKDQISDKDIKIIPSSSDAKGDWAQRTQYFSGSTFRMVSSLRIRFTEVFYYYEILTNPQHRVLGIWGRAQLATRSANGDGYYTATGFEQPLVLTGTISPKAEENIGISILAITTIFSGHYYIDFDNTSYVPAYSRARLDGQYIYVYWPDALENSPPFEEPNWTPGVDEPF